MKLKLSLEDKQMDVRLRDRFVQEGKISSKDVDGYLNDLADEAGNMMVITEDTNKSEESNSTEL